jgi:uncharacterized protein (TIGR03905 family)
MTDTFTYLPKGTCSRKMTFVIDHDTDEIVDFHVEGGCSGNLSGLRNLIIGMNARDVARKLAGTTCGIKPTSCPDQLSKALMSYFDEKEGK